MRKTIQFLLIGLFFLIIMGFDANAAQSSLSHGKSMTPASVHSTSRVALLRRMFHDVAEKKNADLIPCYYDKSFILTSNGKDMNYTEYLLLHKKIYQTPIQYHVSYDENAYLECGDKVSARVFITTKMPNEPAKKIEVMLIAQYNEHDKLTHLWELTYPDWSKMKAFIRLK